MRSSHLHTQNGGQDQSWFLAQTQGRLAFFPVYLSLQSPCSLSLSERESSVSALCLLWKVLCSWEPAPHLLPLAAHNRPISGQMRNMKGYLPYDHITKGFLTDYFLKRRVLITNKVSLQMVHFCFVYRSHVYYDYNILFSISAPKIDNNGSTEAWTLPS